MTVLVTCKRKNDPVGHFLKMSKTPLDGSAPLLANVGIVKKGDSVTQERAKKPAHIVRLFDLAIVAYETGQSLDQLAVDAISAARSFSATSSRKVSQRPKNKKSSVTWNLSTSK
jgi:hypothetical protein